MKQIIKKGSFLTLMFMLLGCLSLYAADNDLITRQITIKLEKAGTLPDKIGSSKKYKITNLKIIGEINGTDLNMIREMAGRTAFSNYTDGKLSVLDLSEAKIVEGGGYYYYGNKSYNYYYTSNDVIGCCAFRDCSGLTSLTLPAGITWIDVGAFYGCSGLTNLNLPDGITKIDYGAFWGCSGLTSLTLPAGITSIGDKAFWYCSGLTSLTLSDGITKIGDWAFEGCSGLKEVRFCINDNLDTYLTKDHPYIDVDCGIKYYINDKEITSIKIPSNVTTLGNYVFQGCSRLTSLTLSDGITKIGFWAFYGCRGLKEVRFCINDNLDTYLTKGHPYIPVNCGIKYYIDINDKEITRIEIPSNVTTLGNYVFQGCSGFTSLTLPAGITSIGSDAFSNCSGLTSIYVYAEKVPEIYSDVFKGVDAKKCTLYVPMGTRDDYWLSDFGDYFENIAEFETTGIDKITINLEKAGTLPDRIENNYHITNLKIIGEINGTDLRMIREMAGSIYSGGKLSVLDLSEAKIVEGGDCYYYDCSTSNDVIGRFAFRGCSGLTSLTLPAGITEINSGAFYGCSGLTSLNLPAGITKIGSYAFEDCSGLTSLTLPAGITEIGSQAFYGCSGLTSLNLPAGITEIGDGAFWGCSGLTSLNLPAGITEIGSQAFQNCSGLTSLNLPAGITSIGDQAFSGCSGLTSLTLPAGITEIGRYAFGDCSGLTNLTLPAGITEIGSCAFWGCSGLTSLNLPAGITSIGFSTFGGCSGLTSLNLPAGITSIGDQAFDGCSGLTSLTLPASITSIGSAAFWGCSGLTSIYVCAEKVPEIGSNVFVGVGAKKCTLYVPMGTRADYRLAGFGDYFENIVEFDATGIDKTTTSTDVEEVARYSVNGQRLSAPTKGLNIVKYSDGSVKKVAVR